MTADVRLRMTQWLVVALILGLPAVAGATGGKIEAPAANATVTAPFTISGWAVGFRCTSGAPTQPDWVCLKDGSSAPPSHPLAVAQATWPGCAGTQMPGWVCVWDGVWFPASHPVAVQQAGNPADGPLVDRVEIWTCPTSCTGTNATFRGVATYGLARPDIASLSGASRWTNSGFSYTFGALASGTYQVQVRMRNALYATSWNTTSVTITVPPSNPVVTLEAPTTNGASVAQPFPVTGWAIDTGAPTGTGVDQVQVWGTRDPGSGAASVLWGNATLGGSRPAVGAQYGSRFTTSGFTLSVSGQPTGWYLVTPYAHSTVTGLWTTLTSYLNVDIPTVPLTIDRQGDGTGGVTASGLTCPGGAATQGVPCGARYTLGTVVTLTAVPDANATFAGWGGVCGGTGACQVTMSTARFVTATFSGTPTATAVVRYYHTDAIGSVRAITDASGTTLTRHDYAPFGEDTQPLTGDPMRFAGKELDPETALEYFGARYYRNTIGRFYTVDPVGGTLTNPQRWNAYAYALNNPLRFVDPTGMLAGNCTGGANGEPVHCSDSSGVNGSEVNTVNGPILLFPGDTIVCDWIMTYLNPDLCGGGRGGADSFTEDAAPSGGGGGAAGAGTGTPAGPTEGEGENGNASAASTPSGPDLVPSATEEAQPKPRAPVVAPVLVHPIVKAAAVMLNRYFEMRTSNLIGADKYYHCVAHCDAARQGSFGRWTSLVGGMAREISDALRGKIDLQDHMQDLEANRQGREGASGSQSCSDVCGSYRVRGIP